MANDFITCENKDQYHLEHLIPQLIGQDESGEYYWRVRGCEPTGPPDYYYFDDFEQAYSTFAPVDVINNFNLTNLIATIQDHYWLADRNYRNTTLENIATPFFGAMKINCHGQDSPEGYALWGGSPFNGGLFKQMRFRFYWDGSGETVYQVLQLGWWDGFVGNNYFIVAVDATGVMTIESSNNTVVANDATGIAFTDGGIYDVVLTMEGTTITAEINGVEIVLNNCSVRDLDVFVPRFYAKNINNLSEKALWIDYIELKHTRATV